MKNRRKNALWLALLLCLLPLWALGSTGGVLHFDQAEQWVDGQRYIVYPRLIAKDASLTSPVQRINQAIEENARIPDYLRLLPTVQAGGSGLVVEYASVESPGLWLKGWGYLSLLVTARGKMLSGRPGTEYYPMVFRVETGERVTFSDVFADVEGAKGYIEQYLTDAVEPLLSTYLENNQLFPVPYDNFAFTGDGLITFYYPKEQLSFLSGAPGAVSFRYSELWDYLDLSEGSVALALTGALIAQGQYDISWDAAAYREFIRTWCGLGTLPGLKTYALTLGSTLEKVARDHAMTLDPGYYPGGAYLETETPQLLGTYLITDQTESYLTGILTSRIDMYGIETGKTTLSEAQALLGTPLTQLPLSADAAQLYLVCPGAACVYSIRPEFPIRWGDSDLQSPSLSLTLYADEAEIVQYIKLSLD